MACSSSGHIHESTIDKIVKAGDTPMGSCVSRSTATVGLGSKVTADVVFQDGSVARFAAFAMAGDALGGDDRAASSWFVCCSDELRFDAPARALAAHDALQAGQLYFVLPISALHRPLSAQDMAALAVKATAALAASTVVAVDCAGCAATAGSSSSSSVLSQDKTAPGKQRPRTARVAPLVADTGRDHHVHGGHDAQDTVHGDRTVGKARNGAKHGGGGSKRAGLERLSAILEGSE